MDKIKRKKPLQIQKCGQFIITTEKYFPIRN
jgi:hypothetical protein